MAKPFPRPSDDAVPTAGADDELLDEIPDSQFDGSLRAYADGSKVRRLVWGGLIVGCIAAGFAGHWYIGYLQEQRRRGVDPGYVVDAEHAATAVRELQWDEGPARFALAAKPPGINKIFLPDRVLTLAEGQDSAQIKVNVQDGKTVMLKVLIGRIENTKKEVPTPPQAPPATAPEN